MEISHGPSTRGIPSSPGVTMRLTAVVLALLTTLVGCGSNDDSGSATTDPPASTTSAPTTTQPTDTRSTTPGTGEDIFGWLRSFEGRDTATVILIDEAEMLTGEEAVAAARRDGVISADEDLPNDFYISNPEDSTTEFTVSPNVVVTLQACYEGGDCVTTEQVDLATWSILLGGEDDPGLDWDWYGQGTLPYIFTVANGMVVEIDEVYLP